MRVLFLFMIFFASSSFAQSFDGESAPTDRARVRNYPGGKDEQDLKVQSVLPSPSRSPEGKDQEMPTSRPID